MSLKAFELVPVIEDFASDKQRTAVKMSVCEFLVDISDLRLFLD